MSGLEPIAVIGCVAAVVSALHAAAELLKRRRIKANHDSTLDAGCCYGLCPRYQAAWGNCKSKRALRRRIMVIAYEIEVAYLVCPKLVRRNVTRSFAELNFGEDGKCRYLSAPMGGLDLNRFSLHAQSGD